MIVYDLVSSLVSELNRYSYTFSSLVDHLIKIVRLAIKVVFQGVPYFFYHFLFARIIFFQA